jgi:hypothetical protein
MYPRSILFAMLSLAKSLVGTILSRTLGGMGMFIFVGKKFTEQD